MPAPLDLGRSLLELDRADLVRLFAEADPEELSVYEQALDAVEAERRSRRWLDDPALWADEVLAARLHPYQTDALSELAETGRLAVRSPHGVGKTGLAAVGILWFATSREAAGIGWKIPTTASVYRQLKHYLWPEVHVWARRLRWEVLGRPAFSAMELQQMGLKLVHGEAWAMASHDPASIEGAHARHLLYVLDEAKAIPDDVWDAAEGAFSGAGADTNSKAWALAISTPGEPSGRFYQISRRARRYSHWSARHVTLRQAIAAGQVSAEWAATMAKQWTPGSAIYANRVLGDFAASPGESVIPLPWVEAANERWHEALERGEGEAYPTHAGLDVARFGSDENVLVLLAGDVVGPLQRPAQGDSIAVANAVLPYVGTGPYGPLLLVDADGVGAGVYDQLRVWPDLAPRLRPFIAGERSDWQERTGVLRFGNLRAASWWHLRDLLNPTWSPSLALPPDDLLTGDLTTPRWRQGQGDRVYIESKDDIKKRIGRSTDAGDALVMAVWGRVVGAMVVIEAASHDAGRSLITGDLLGPDAVGF